MSFSVLVHNSPKISWEARLLFTWCICGTPDGIFFNNSFHMTVSYLYPMFKTQDVPKMGMILHGTDQWDLSRMLFFGFTLK